jgi:ABC-type sugar transport system substrate-binding protein
MKRNRPNNLTLREAIRSVGVLAGTTLLTGLAGSENSFAQSKDKTESGGNEEYVWLSANANLPLFVAHDHPTLRLAGETLGVKVTIAGPNSVDIRGLVEAVEQTAARKPAGMMVVGWDPSGLIPAINSAIDAGIPVVCVDADVPNSKRYSFIGLRPGALISGSFERKGLYKSVQEVSKKSQRLGSNFFCKLLLLRRAPGVIRTHNLLIRSHFVRLQKPPS